MTNKTKDKILTILPFVMLFYTALCGVFVHYNWYVSLYPYLSESIGYSLVTNFALLLLYSRKAFCLQTKLAVVGLAVMNIITMAFNYNDWIYNQIYDLWLVLFIFAIVSITLFKWEN